MKEKLERVSLYLGTERFTSELASSVCASTFILLDWLDCSRIEFWISFHYLDKLFAELSMEGTDKVTRLILRVRCDWTRFKANILTYTWQTNLHLVNYHVKTPGALQFENSVKGKDRKVSRMTQMEHSLFLVSLSKTVTTFLFKINIFTIIPLKL